MTAPSPLGFSLDLVSSMMVLNLDPLLVVQSDRHLMINWRLRSDPTQTGG